LLTPCCSQAGVHDRTQLIKQKIRIISKTNMTELVEDEYQKLADVPEMKAEFLARQAELAARKEAIFDAIDHEPEAVRKVAAFFADTARVAELKQSASLTADYLNANHGIGPDMLEAYYKFSKFKYDCGIYDEAGAMLANYLTVSQPQSPSVLGALWGRLNCKILQAKWEESMQDLVAIKETIENRNIAPADQIRQRAWLLHCALFVYLNQREGTDTIVDLFLEPSFMQTVENLCPWLLRYFTVSIILTRRRRSMITDVLNEIQSMKYMYSDPVTQFVESLFDSFDFDEAQSRLVDCKEMLKNDFFLNSYADKFMDEARLLICELYCALNRRVDLRMLSSKLELSEEDAEKWMVDMVRGTMVGSSVDAKIDSTGKQVLMPAPANTTHQVVMDRTRDLTERSSVLVNNLDSLAQEQAVYLKLRHGITVGRATGR
jgi:translation initiation factor 3 subunit E